MAANEQVAGTAGAGDDREVVFYEGSPALRSALGTLLGAGLVALVLIGGSIFFASPHRWWIPIVGLLLGTVAVVLPIFLVRAVRYRITSYRIDYERGLLSKSIDTLELWHVEDLNFRQSLWERLLNVGRIKIISHDISTPELVLRGLPNPRPVFEALKERVIVVKRQRGVVKLDAG